MDNSPISNHELLGRNVTFPMSYNVKKNRIKAGRFYPFKKEDRENPGFFTNKISLVRLCKALGEEGIPEWREHINIVVKLNDNKLTQNGDRPQLRGILVVRVDDFTPEKFDVVPAASKDNPYHLHIIIKDYAVPFRPVSSVGEVIPEDIRYQLDMLQKKAFLAAVDEERRDVTNASSPCAICDTI